MEEQCIASGLVMGHGTRAIRFSSGSAGDLWSFYSDVDRWHKHQGISSRRPSDHTLYARGHACMEATEIGGGRGRASSRPRTELEADLSTATKSKSRRMVL